MGGGDDITMSGLALHSAFTTLNKYYNKFNPTKIICTFDRPNWRKVYTQSDLCISGAVYKGTRRQDMTPAEQHRYNIFQEHIKSFEEIVRKRTSMVCLAADMLEADDLMAGFVEMYPEDKVIVVSADKDLIQLLKYPNVRLINPIDDKERTEDDIDWFMFLKCIRGDRGDNVMSAYPRVRETKVRAAFEDEFERLSLMNHTFKIMKEVDGVDVETEVCVGELFEENKLLMDLFDQPSNIRALIRDTIEDGMVYTGKYSHFHFIKFCNKHDLKRIVENVDNYVKMLSR
jgi:hypothetical protein